ncbi:2-dehydropantoate 2-reductase [Caballeronia temeraria]|uniref:2-dehydropantoate 2-reductase n=2 Tax=Caballeronia temeraria TaxID=1777137 RepID=A0A158CLK3_9BURK|nr:2-dehydropantoate 2-reductase [Caballeronia temeraria]
MGSLFGGRLAEAGHSVTLIDINQPHLDAIDANGLRLEIDGDTRAIKNIAAMQPGAADKSPHVLLVFTKSMHTRAALSGIEHLLGETTAVLTLQNGLGNVEAIRDFVPLSNVLVGVTTWPADLVGPGSVSSHGEGTIRMMSADGERTPKVNAVAEALNSAGLNCQIDDNVWAAIWEKVAFNAALNSICAVTGTTVDQLGLLEDSKSLALAVAAEVVSVANASGVSADLNVCSANIVHAIEQHKGHKPSMLQDVLARRKTEIEGINGAVVEVARKLNVSVPHTETLAKLVKLIDARNAPAVAK